MNLKRAQSLLEAMIANSFWGFGFTATIWSLQSFTLSQILFIRFAVVGVGGILWAVFCSPNLIKPLLKLSLLPSIFLIMEILFQIWGLETTTATNAGFLTVTYIVMVPVIEVIFTDRRISISHWFCVALALVGTLLMAEVQNLRFHLGDFLILVSALGASLHMLVVDRVGKKEKHLFLTNTMQSLWGALILLPLLILKADAWPAVVSGRSWIGLASLTFGSTMLAFYFQMRAQRSLSPSVASLLFLIESPIAAGFGLWLLNEEMTILQWFGCLLILSSAAGVIILNLQRPSDPIEKNTKLEVSADKPSQL